MGRGGIRETPSRGQELTAAASFPTLLELFILLYVYECLSACVYCIMCVSVGSPGTELWMVVRHHVDGDN